MEKKAPNNKKRLPLYTFAENSPKLAVSSVVIDLLSQSSLKLQTEFAQCLSDCGLLTMAYKNEMNLLW